MLDMKSKVMEGQQLILEGVKVGLLVHGIFLLIVEHIQQVSNIRLLAVVIIQHQEEEA